jgi:hypothetical protein
MSLSNDDVNKLKSVFVFEENSLSRYAIHQLIPFDSTFLCETECPNYVATKTKYRNIINAVPDLII